MGFSKNALPSDVKNLKSARLTAPQRYVLADYLGIGRQYKNLRPKEKRPEFLDEYIQNNLERAQQGYDIVVLGKQPVGAGSVAADVEKRMYELATNLIDDHKNTLGEDASKAVTDAVDAIVPKLFKEAQRIVTEVAEKTKPFVIKSAEGKIKKVKGILPPEFERMVQLGSQRVNICLVGPAGCGKTYLSAKLAEALDLDYADQSLSEGVSESEFTGKLLPIGKGGSFEYVPSPFIQMYENGGVFLFDEMDNANSNQMVFLNKALANDSITVPARYTNPLVKKHKDFVAIAAMNTFGDGSDAQYVGRNQLDAATMDRFRVGMLCMDYSRDVELSIGGEELCQWAWKIRDGIRKHRIRRIMSTRTITDMAKMVRAYDWKLPDWEKAYFTNWTAEERRMVNA